MFNMGKLVGVAVVVLALSGCGAAVASDGVAKSAAPEVVASAVPSETPTAAPLVAEPAPAAPTSPDWGDLSQEEFYLASLVGTWEIAEPAPEQQVAAGWYACEQLTSGVPEGEIVAIVGDTESAKVDNTDLINTAIYIFCPEFA